MVSELYDDIICSISGKEGMPRWQIASYVTGSQVNDHGG